MGDIIGGVIGGIGSIIGGNKAADAEKDAAKQALTGYNYLSTNSANQAAQGAVQPAQAAQGTVQNSEAQLLGQAPVTDATQNGFNNYLNSTGYQFQQQQGTAALTGSAAARGLLNSGATAKALTSYGQGLAGSSFNNYLGQLGTLSGQYGSTINTGVGAANAVGAAGNTGGGNAATQTAAAGQSTGTSIAQAANTLGGGTQNAVNSGQLTNFFAGL